MRSVLLKSPFRVFSLRRSWKLSLSSNNRALAIRVSNRVFSSSWTVRPPIFSSSTNLICASASSSRSNSMTLSFCMTTLEWLIGSLRSREEGGAKCPFSMSAEDLLLELAGSCQLYQMGFREIEYLQDLDMQLSSSGLAFSSRCASVSLSL